MPEITRTLEMTAAPDAVWSVAGDMARYGEWNEVHVAFPDGTPALAEGARFREQVTIMGMPGEAAWTVAEVDAPNGLRLEGDGPMGIKLGMSLAVVAQGAGSAVTMTSAFEGGPLQGPMGDAVAKAGGTAAEQSLRKISALVERP